MRVIDQLTTGPDPIRRIDEEGKKRIVKVVSIKKHIFVDADVKL